MNVIPSVIDGAPFSSPYVLRVGWGGGEDLGSPSNRKAPVVPHQPLLRLGPKASPRQVTRACLATNGRLGRGGKPRPLFPARDRSLQTAPRPPARAEATPTFNFPTDKTAGRGARERAALYGSAHRCVNGLHPTPGHAVSLSLTVLLLRKRSLSSPFGSFCPV